MFVYKWLLKKRPEIHYNNRINENHRFIIFKKYSHCGPILRILLGVTLLMRHLLHQYYYITCNNYYCNP